MTTEKTSFMLLAVICLAGIALAIAQPASVSSDGTVSSVNLTAWYPLDETINDIEGATRAFNVSTNQPVTASWLLNGTEVFNQSGVNISEYTATAAAGYCNVTAYAYNQNSSDMRTWRWTVRTVSANDTTPPTVISHAPTGTKVSVKADVTATFNETMNPVSLNNATLIVCDSSGSSVTGNITYDSETKATVTFDPLRELEYNETYNVTITTGVQDLAGNNMSLDFCWHFTTRREILRIPIVISGYVIKNGTWLLNPDVTITNLDTGKNFATVETHPNSSYYRMWTDSTHVSAGDTLRFSVSTGEIVIDRNVTEAEIEHGGFRQDLPGMPDLIITNITFGDVVNETFNINFTVENIGSEEASESNASICVEYSTGIAMLNYSVKPLAPGENKTITVGPFSCPCRDIKICADRYDALAEFNDTNNCFETRSPCPLPNLGPSKYGSFTDERGKHPELCEFNSDDGTFNIYYRIFNNDPNESPASTATINITTIANNGSVVSCDVVNDSIPPLSGGYKLRTLGPFPYLCNHTVNVTICADGYNEILEISERDNCLNETYYPVCTKPDLRIVHFSGTWLNQTNRVFNITYTVKNCGDTTANASTTRISNTGFYCRPSDVIFDPVPVLAPHASCARTVGPFTRLCEGPAPDTDPAKYSSKLQIYADCNNTVSESETGEANNERVFLFGLPYLNIDLCKGWWVSGKNKTFRVEYRLVNEGGFSGKSSNESTLRAYIDGNLCNVNDTVPPLSVGGSYLDRWGIGPLPIPADKDTIKYKLCIVLEDDKERCTPEVAFGGGGCIAEDGTPFTFGGAWGGVASGTVSITKSCTFNGDIYYPQGICIGADNIVIDGNGSGISGDRSGCTGHVIYSDVGRIYVYRGKSGIRNYVHSGNRGFRGYDNVTIKNMNIRNFCDGIAVINADNNRIENCSVHDNGLEEYTYGINVVNSDNTTIDMCEVYNNTGNNFTIAMVCGGHGINFHDDCNYCAVTNSHVFHNYLSGILATPTCKYLFIANNLIEENGYCNESGFCAGVNLHWKGGFGQITNSTVEHNVIRNNTGPGIYVTQGYTTLTNNLVSESKNGTNVTGNGIFVDGGRVTFLHNNTCCENDGTDIFDRGFTTYGDDNTCNTTFNYDDEGTFGCNFYCRGENGACVGATRTFRCGDFVTESCTFNRSMSCRGGAGDGLVVGADDVTIDGAGYALTGNYSGTGIISNHTNVTITNLQVEDFSTGMNIGNTNTIDTCVVRTNLVTGLNVSANNGTMRNNLIYDNAGPGIFVDGINSTFVNNTVARNKGYGIYFSPDARGNNLTANFFGDNEGMEIYNDNGESNTGYNNTCDTAYNYNDTGMTDYNCTYAWTMPDLVISDKHENWVDEKSARYSVTYTVDNIGKPNSRPADSSTTYLSINYAFTATDGVSSLNASANYSSTFGYTPEMKEDKDTIKVCADGADAVKENNEADTYYYNDVMSEYYNLAGFFADKEANNCLENVLSKCGTIYDWDADAACRAADGTEYRCGDQDPDKRIVMKSCEFTGNMKCPSGHGLIVGRSGIRIDGKDFVIGRDESASSCASVTESNPSGGDCGILNTEHNNVEITNLKIVHFCNGIGIQGSKAKPINGNIIEHCKIHDNGNPVGMSHGIHMACVKGTTIRNNEIYNNRGTGVGCGDGGNGIFLYAGGIGTANNVISGNYLHDNDRAGFWTKQGMQGSTINNNKVWGNSRGSGFGGMTGGIVLQCVRSSNNLIEDNEVWDNAGRCGLFIGGNDNTLCNNDVQDNKGDGIYMGRNDGSKDNELNGNTVCDNEDMDIRTCGMDHGNTGADNYCDTTDNYADTNAPEGSKCAKKCSTVPKPDLEITGKNETWIVEGKSYKVIYTVRNSGKVAANASTTRIQIIDGDSKPQPVRALAPAESETYEVGPFNMSGDSDMIEVCVDCEGLVEKYGLDSRANNCLTNTWSALPDLIVTEISVPNRLSFGTSNIITATIKNAGTVRTDKAFTVALFIVPSAVPIDTASAQSELLAGSSTPIKLSWTPSAPGRHTLRVVADWSETHEGEIHESNEGNNEKLLTITEGTLGLELPEGPIRGGGGGGGGATKNTETIDVPGADAGEISTGAATKEVPVNESKTVKEEQKTGTGHPFGEGETLETVKVVAPVLLVVALITIVIVLFYLGYRKEKKVYRRRR